MQNSHESRKHQEIRVRLHKHPFDLIELGRRRTLLLLRLLEPSAHSRKYLELEIRHRLVLDPKRNVGRGLIDLEVLGTKLPEVVREDDGLVIRLCSGRVPQVGYHAYV